MNLLALSAIAPISRGMITDESRENAKKHISIVAIVVKFYGKRLARYALDAARQQMFSLATFTASALNASIGRRPA